MNDSYNNTAPCGFCRFYGQVSTTLGQDVCHTCEIHAVREALEILADKALWEHDHRYCGDMDEAVHKCAHCKHAIMDSDTCYHAAQYADDVYCWLDMDTIDEGEELPKRSAFSSCDKWERSTWIRADRRTR